MRLSRMEQETHITHCATDDCADVYTSDPIMMRRMDKLVAKRPDIFSVIASDDISRTYRCPKKCVRVNPPRAVREMTEEQRAAAAERLRRARETRA